MRSLIPALALVLASCAHSGPSSAQRRVEAVSLLGSPLYAPPLSGEVRAKRESELAEALERLARAPEDPDALIWAGRRLAYLGRYREAVETFTRGIELHPADARMFRHRGHRYITLRRFADAIRDLERGMAIAASRPDEIEPDGLPNPRNVPIGTLRSNLAYHLGLAHYLQGDFDRAAAVFSDELARANNADRVVSASYWLHLSLRRLGRDDQARAILERIPAAAEVIENHAYRDLLLLFRGDASAQELMRKAEEGIDAATVTYGVGAAALIEGDRAAAASLFREILRNPQWAAFGYIAAEADLVREERPP
ncbi:MAG TPA: tetratricopeptide repeat protein [Thermoanaerobaculia bacterium]|nr:tetratricopeptide repeat protein [Thermoanaerobaculia bacterium]